MHSKQLIVSIIILGIAGIAKVTQTSVVNTECWSTSGCHINCTEIPLKSPSHMHTSTIYDCTHPRANEPKLSKYCNSNSNFTLNGCHADRVDTIGTEYIKEPDCVASLIIEKFRADSVRSVFKNFTRLTELVLRENGINSINRMNFLGLELLTHLELRNNKLYTIANGTFDDMHALNSLTIIEPRLRILRNLSFGNIIDYIHIEAKSIEWPHLPDSVIGLKIFNTFVNTAHEFILFQNMYELQSVSICFCNLTEFPMMESNTMVMLNFSDNIINTFVAHKLINLITFDISRNKLPRVSSMMLGEMKKLEIFLAADNLIESVSDRAFINNTHLKHIDLTNNRLRMLDIRFPVVSTHGPPTTRIIVNGNPWSCDWLSRAAVDQHHLFVCFEFESHNPGDHVLGLQCTKAHDSPNNTQLSTTSESPSSSQSTFETTSPATTTSKASESTLPPTTISASSESNSPGTATSAATTTIITVLSVALACTLILSIILYVKHRRHSQAFRPQRVDEHGNFFQNVWLRRRGQAVPEADNSADSDENR